MWYEALPPLFIIGTLMYSYQIASLYTTRAMFGNPYRRELEETWDRNHLERDARICGAPWRTPGLENIPDK